MGGTTPRLALPYPVAADSADVPRDIKALSDKLDLSGVAYASGTAAARPAAGTAGRFYYATDTDQIYYDTGTSWTAWSPGARLSALPANPVDGQKFSYIWPSNVGGYGVPIVWRFEYVASAARWYFIGGPPWESPDFPNRAGFNTAALGTYLNLDNSGTDAAGFVLPFAGVYAYRVAYQVNLGLAGGKFQMALATNGAATLGVGRVDAPSGATMQLPVEFVGAVGASAIGTVLNLYGSTNNIAANVAPLRSRFEVIPIYITT